MFAKNKYVYFLCYLFYFDMYHFCSFSVAFFVKTEFLNEFLNDGRNVCVMIRRYFDFANCTCKNCREGISGMLREFLATYNREI